MEFNVAMEDIEAIPDATEEQFKLYADQQEIEEDEEDEQGFYAYMAQELNSANIDN